MNFLYFYQSIFDTEPFKILTFNVWKKFVINLFTAFIFQFLIDLTFQTHFGKSSNRVNNIINAKEEYNCLRPLLLKNISSRNAIFEEEKLLWLLFEKKWLS